MKLFDTARGGIFPLEAGPTVTMYSCGITPYDSAHLGHAFVYLAFDVVLKDPAVLLLESPTPHMFDVLAAASGASREAVDVAASESPES